MKLGILLCDDHYPDAIAQYGHYDDAFKRMFADSAITAFESFRCFESEFPDAPSRCDIWLVTGSKWGVYDTDPWIETLRTFIQSCHQQKRAMIGVCFGHQLLHHALGGKVEKSDKGWGMGVYPVGATGSLPAYATPLPRQLHLIACHQDQVISPAPGFSIIAGSDFCPVAISHLDEHILTLQCHPEFTPDFLAQLIERLREKAGDTVIDRAIATLAAFGEGHREEAISLIYRFCEKRKQRE